MRRFLSLFFLFMAVLPVRAADKITVQQLEQALAESHGKSDGQVAQWLSELELTERLSEARLARLEADLHGPRTHRALTLLADASAFLGLPASELPATPAPDRAAQVAMLGLARNYIALTVLKLPNFFATRETTSFVSTSADPWINSVHTVPYVPFHEIDTSKVTVLYRDGHELAANGKKYRASVKDLRTRGEFGPILVVVLNDASKGKVVWGHWERGVAGPQAVFEYAVSPTASHYQVTSPGLAQESQYYPAYHGEIAINPADGSILRITVVAELKPDDPMTSADLMVEYGPTEIGGMNYICPIKSVALSKVRIVNREMDDQWDVVRNSLGPPQTYLNEILFTHYHLFRAEAHILTGSSEGPEENPSASVAGNASSDAQPAAPEVETPNEATGTRFTIADLEQALALDKTYGTPDEEVVQHLSKVQLTERLTDARLARLQAELPGPIVRQALEALADTSAFLDLPEADIPTQRALDKSAQASLLASAMDYVQKTIPKLPNLSAIRETNRFEYRPVGGKTAYRPLQKVSSSSSKVLYLDGHESLGEGTKHRASTQRISDVGEFGPILAVVLSDAMKGSIEWSHWERGTTGLSAVFSYDVSKASSHYPLSATLDDASAIGGAPARVKADIDDRPAYHGEIALNPADGSILRLTMRTEFKLGDQEVRADFLEEFAPVEIGGAAYLCPAKAVLIELQSDLVATRVQGSPSRRNTLLNLPPKERLSTVMFKKYHSY